MLRKDFWWAWKHIWNGSRKEGERQDSQMERKMRKIQQNISEFFSKKVDQ